MTPFNDMSKEESAILGRRVDKLTAEYQKEKAKLKNFYAKRKSLEYEMWSVPVNISRLIYLKCLDVLPVVEKYYNKPLEKKEEQSERTDLYLSMSLLASVHELCNGRQFIEMSPIDFFHALNLNQTSKPLEVCKNEKIWVCYLMKRLKRKSEVNESELCSGLQISNLITTVQNIVNPLSTYQAKRTRSLQKH